MIKPSLGSDLSQTDSPLTVEQAKERLLLATAALGGTRHGSMISAHIDALITAVQSSSPGWQPISSAPKACACSVPDPVMQADEKFYCYRCSYQTGARPHHLEPEGWMTQLRWAKAEIAALRGLCGAVYQMAGACGAPKRFLDALSFATRGAPFDTEGLLPVLETEFKPPPSPDPGGEP